MLNFIRNLMLNLNNAQQAGATFPEIIPSDFNPTTYVSSLENIRQLIFTPALTLDDRVYIAFQTTRLVYSLETVAHLEPLGDILAFNLNSTKFFGAGLSSKFNIVSLEQRIANSGEVLVKFKAFVRKVIDQEVFQILDILSQSHKNHVWRLCALLTMWYLAAFENFKKPMSKNA